MFPKFRDNALSRNLFKDRIVECLRIACQIDREDFEYALLKPKREEFLHIFLNRGFLIHKYLDPKRLRQLFAKIQHEEFFRTVCWEGALGHSLLSKIGRNFIEMDLNWLIETTTGLRDFLNQEELSANSAVGTYVKDAASAERKALVILSLWAVFTNRRKTAEVLWKNCDQPIHLALLVSMTYERLTVYVSEGTIKQELLDTSKQFAAMASGVLNLCYLESRCRAYDILSVQTADWKYKTAVDIAAEASNRQFLSHPCCQKWLTNHFLGCISVRDIPWGFFSVPLGLKCETRFKTTAKRKRNEDRNNRTSGHSRYNVVFEEEFAAIRAIDDSLEPEVLRGVKKVTYKKVPSAAHATAEDPNLESSVSSNLDDNSQGFINTALPEQAENGRLHCDGTTPKERPVRTINQRHVLTI
ncbi:hypothetical protein HPB49_003670 [Dermacentor silvarum]|uniref:Uncharacterized protein n=1 Tax=Dermacentor silvarum TaxID=543639 RepID=A0ACB8CV62_DERSI|nr:hypothetical protein HPB49_003670 [Dermacentor silvarum]